MTRPGHGTRGATPRAVWLRAEGGDSGGQADRCPAECVVLAAWPLPLWTRRAGDSGRATGGHGSHGALGERLECGLLARIPPDTVARLAVPKVVPHAGTLPLRGRGQPDALLRVLRGAGQRCEEREGAAPIRNLLVRVTGPTPRAGRVQQRPGRPY